MSPGKARYEERRALEKDNEMMRALTENKRFQREKLANETADVVMAGLKAFFKGAARLEITERNYQSKMVRFIKE